MRDIMVDPAMFKLSDDYIKQANGSNLHDEAKIQEE